MTDDGPNTLIGALFQIVFGLVGLILSLAMMGALLVLLVALLGATFDMFLGSAPRILEPFGGALVGLVADLVRLLANVLMVIGAIVIIWLVVTGRMDEVVGDTFDEQETPDSQRRGSTSNRNSTQGSRKKRPKTKSSNASLPNSRDPTDSASSDSDTEFDDYGQIK